MAWALVNELGSTFETDGTFIYSIEPSSGDIRKYFFPDDTFTVLGNRSAVGATLRWWKGKLYASKFTSGSGPVGSIEVYRYSGIGTIWTLVDKRDGDDINNDLNNGGWANVDLDSGTNSIFTFFCGETHMVNMTGFIKNFDAPSNNMIYLRFSTDGLTWQTGSVSTAAPYDYENTTAPAIVQDRKLGIFFNLFFSGPGEDVPYEFSNGVFSPISGWSTSTVLLFSAGGGHYWRQNYALNNLEHSTDLSSWTVLSDQTVELNVGEKGFMSQPIGTTHIAGDLYVVYWDGSQWGANEVARTAETGDLSGSARTDNGDFFLFFPTISGNWFSRSTKLSGPPGDDEHLYDEAQILYGRDQLTKQPVSPLNGVFPGAFLRLGTTAFLGGDDGASAVRVAYSLFSGNGYPSWVDFTDNYPASAVQALDGTPFGDSEDTEESDSSSGAGGFTDEKGCT